MGRGRKRHRRHNTGLAAEITSVLPEPPLAVLRAEPKAQVEMARADLLAVDPQDVETFWPLASDLIASELPNTDWTDGQLKYACMTGAATLWLVCDQNDDALAAMVTLLTDRQRCLVAICSGKNLWDYLPAREQLYAWAKDQGMKEVTYYGRPALAKLMPECKRAGVILRKEL